MIISHHCGVSWPIDFLARHLGPCSKYHVDHDFGNSSSLNGTSVSSHLVLHDLFSPASWSSRLCRRTSLHSAFIALLFPHCLILSKLGFPFSILSAASFFTFLSTTSDNSKLHVRSELILLVFREDSFQLVFRHGSSIFKVYHFIQKCMFGILSHRPSAGVDHLGGILNLFRDLVEVVSFCVPSATVTFI